jgi:hypothetical protein
MNYRKDIKVTFINAANNGITEKIRVFFKDIFSNDIQIDLRPGEVVYSQTNHLSNSLKIYSRKGIIEIKEEAKPNFLKYYVGYKQEEIDDKHFLHNLQTSLKKDELKKIIKEQIKTEVKNPELQEITENPELQEITENPELQEIAEKQETKETVIDKAIKEVKKYFEKKKKTKSRRGPGRPKKRGPKKGSKRKKVEE